MPYADIQKRREVARNYNNRNKAQITENYSKWVLQNPEKHKMHQRRYEWKSVGLDPDEAETFFLTQPHVCAICGTPENGKALHLDHDHKTLKIRGFLCGGCNKGLGFFLDNPQLLYNAIEYLNRSEVINV